jgi:hypothetical protein
MNVLENRLVVINRNIELGFLTSGNDHLRLIKYLLIYSGWQKEDDLKHFLTGLNFDEIIISYESNVPEYKHTRVYVEGMKDKNVNFSHNEKKIFNFGLDEKENPCHPLIIRMKSAGHKSNSREYVLNGVKYKNLNISILNNINVQFAKVPDILQEKPSLTKDSNKQFSNIKFPQKEIPGERKSLKIFDVKNDVLSPERNAEKKNAISAYTDLLPSIVDHKEEISSSLLRTFILSLMRTHQKNPNKHGADIYWFTKIDDQELSFKADSKLINYLESKQPDNIISINVKKKIDILKEKIGLIADSRDDFQPNINFIIDLPNNFDDTEDFYDFIEYLGSNASGLNLVKSPVIIIFSNDFPNEGIGRILEGRLFIFEISLDSGENDYSIIPCYQKDALRERANKNTQAKN